MADKLVLIDTSILIDLFRKTDKNNSALVALVRQGYDYCILPLLNTRFTQVQHWDKLNSGTTFYKRQKFFHWIKWLQR
jgi:hypothetical protein